MNKKNEGYVKEEWVKGNRYIFIGGDVVNFSSVSDCFTLGSEYIMDSEVEWYDTGHSPDAQFISDDGNAYWYEISSFVPKVDWRK